MSMDTVLSQIKRHPDAIAWDKWLESDEGKRCSSPDSFCPSNYAEYLRNRLHNAFEAGLKAAREAADGE